MAVGRLVESPVDRPLNRFEAYLEKKRRREQESSPELIFFRVLHFAHVIDCIISIPALKASITPIANTLNGFLLNRITALINEAANNAAINDAGTITKGSSFVNITIVSIFIFTPVCLTL